MKTIGGRSVVKDGIVSRHNTPEEAYAAACKAAKRMHGEFFNDGSG